MAGSVITRLLASQGQYVDLDTNQVISGTKLIQILQTPNIPTVNNDVVNKQYHDNLISYASGIESMRQTMVTGGDTTNIEAYMSGIGSLSQWTQTHLTEVENYTSGTTGTGSGSNPALESYTSGIASNLNLGSYGARCYYSGNITINDVTVTRIPLSNERWDTGNFHNASTPTLASRLTVPTGLGGPYIIGANANFEENNAGQRTLYLLLNGTTVIAYQRTQASSANATILCLNTIYYLNENDYIEMMVYQNSGNPRILTYSPAFSPEMWIQRI